MISELSLYLKLTKPEVKFNIKDAALRLDLHK